MRKALLFLFLSAGTAYFGHAQLLTHSPYSRFGMGEVFFQGFADQQAMGQTGTAMRSTLSYSILNPASYSALNKTNFRFGVLGYFGDIAQGSQKQATNGAGLNYFTLGFQVNKKKTWGLVFGVTPYSSFGYDVVNARDSANGGYTDYLSGIGGVTRYFLGTGRSFGQHFSLGLQASYLHGRADISRAIEYPDGSTNYNYKETSTDYMRGFSGEAGAQYYFTRKLVVKHRDWDSTLQQKIVRRDTTYWTHTFGGTYSMSGTLKNNRTFFARTFVRTGNVEFVLDTILLDESQKGTTVLPSTFGFGYVLNEKNGHWRFALDYRVQKWSEYKSPFENQSLVDAWQGSFGMAWRPSTDFFNEKVFILAKSEYRIGARYGQTNLRLRDTYINELGISFGIGIPLRTRTVNEEFKYETVFSSLDLSVEYLQRGTLANNLIQENYWRFVLGLSLNDKWFNKRKIE